MLNFDTARALFQFTLTADEVTLHARSYRAFKRLAYRGPRPCALVIIAEASRYCNDCSWPYQCAAANECYRRALGNVRAQALSDRSVNR